MKSIYMALLAIIYLPVHAASYEVQIGGSIKAVAVESHFDKSKHNLVQCQGKMSLCSVDGAVPVGGLSEPKTSLDSITVYTEDKIYRLDTSNMYDPLLAGTGFSKRFNGFCYDKLNCEFRAIFGDAGGTYAVEWHIANGLSYRSVLSASDDVINLFKEHPLPARYN